MKVKVGQLKARLSQYLRQIEETGETLEVCVRETAVAYLKPIAVASSANKGPAPEILQSVAESGVRLVQWGEKDNFVPTPRPAGDGKNPRNSVVAMREEKDW
ncbi:MAG: hypothetical protein JJT96_16975 [Opitutales bacterium]|nr:hypothetical protein [Opitutales bacterium]